MKRSQLPVIAKLLSPWKDDDLTTIQGSLGVLHNDKRHGTRPDDHHDARRVVHHDVHQPLVHASHHHIQPLVHIRNREVPILVSHI
jgi:hypothetical protein